MEVANGLRKGDPALQSLLEEQELVNRKQAKEMRQPEVLAMVPSPLASYALGTECPVLIYSMPLPGPQQPRDAAGSVRPGLYYRARRELCDVRY